MINLNYEYRIYSSKEQEEALSLWLEICRKVYNYALAERKDWIKSRKSPVNSCSLVKEYIIPPVGDLTKSSLGLDFGFDSLIATRDVAAAMVREQRELTALGHGVMQSVEEKGYGGKEQSLPSSSQRSRKSKS